MQVEEFSKSLFEEMETLTAEEDIETIEGAKNVSVIMLRLIEKLRMFISNYQFENTGEEIQFFKIIKPKFFTELFYTQNIFKIVSNLPVGLSEDKNEYFITELSGIQKYIESNKDFLLYYRSGSCLFDEIYFVRKPPDLWLSLTAAEYGDQIFTTVYDNKLAKLLAYNRLSTFLINSINSVYPKGAEHPITWTGSKAALIELLYALQTNGSCNNGAIDVKELASHFENIFNVKLGNFYRTFQEIRIRKMSRTTFLDQLKESLIRRMDHSDENPKW